MEWNSWTKQVDEYEEEYVCDIDNDLLDRMWDMGTPEEVPSVDDIDQIMEHIVYVAKSEDRRIVQDADEAREIVESWIEKRQEKLRDNVKTNWNGKYDTERFGCFQNEKGLMFLGYFTQEHQVYGLFVNPDYDGDGSDVWDFFVDFERKHKRSVSRIDRVTPRIYS